MGALFENVYQMTKINLRRQDTETHKPGCFQDSGPGGIPILRECDERQMFT